MIVHTIRVFPDTGHHIVFLPLLQEGSTPQTGHDLPNLSAEQADWVREQCGDSDWVFGNKKPWLRSRFGRKPLAGSSNPDDMLLGLWVALETNIGTPARGYVIQGKAREEAGATYRGQKIVSTTQKRSGTADPIVGNPYIAGPGEALEETQSIDLSEAFGFTDILSDVTLEVVWVEAAGEPVTVDIIVDFGNSRTVVLALERIPGAGGFASICRPILFPGPGWDVDSLNYDEVNFDQVIPESWFTLMDPVFPVSASRDSTEAKSVSASSKKSLFGRGQSATSVAVKRAPHMFSDISPAVVGPAAKKVLSKLDVDEGGLSFLSSPKRYVWDDQPTGLRGDTFWTMNAQPWRKPQISRNRLTPLHGEILRFMPEAEADWSLDGTVSSWPGAEEINEDRRPNHSRADSLTWVALSIMEQAQRQIHSETWRKGNQPFLPRKLGRMLVTYPAGWTEEEINAYHKKWSFARDIFAVSRMDNPMGLAAENALPEVALELDEAVAPQLAIIFSEIHHMRD